ncbi:aldo/keto reductase [Kibdelosporangium philippinense]|uniref:Aldo/keto reductase n=1 Tax=Kibdelosporangium philippinense TaxID=211113 RepID=A0ABS8Z8U2_9PSEU|nr:aldo/keto reductase [Kibdelosporangium philippinense]MCE7004309.1 aldo/keto reductase [Kibdelosporangium philippinense]
MKYRTIGQDPKTRREVSVLALGTMHFGTGTDEETAFAILDRYVDAGGTFIDTSNNYAFWVNSSQGGQSEAVLGRWRASRHVPDSVLIATKLGGRPNAAGLDFAATAKPENIEGLSAKVIRESAERSRDTLGVNKIDLLYAHVEDTATPLQETVEGFAELVTDGTVGLLGVSNHWSWRVERARALAAAAGLPGYELLQYQYSYLRSRTDRPGRRSQDGNQGYLSGDLLAYLRETPDLSLVAYSPLLGGAYAHADRDLGPDWDHSGTPLRRTALQEVAKETGATVNQVVLAWMLGGDLPIIPLVGASSVKQIEESIAAVDLELSADQRLKLNSTH